MTFNLHDTLTRETVPFQPRDDGKAAIYVCGPTVYGDTHVGHGRCAVVFDVLNRYLRYRGYDVTFVMNVTDVDDKIIVRASEEAVAAYQIADRYTRAWNRAMDALGVRPPDVQPRATAHIAEMQQLIQRLIDLDHAYVSDGNVLFRVRSFPGYGKLSRRRLEDAQQPTDVAGVVKEEPTDFALWKAAKPGEPSWSSPWGDGRPGWHIECSAMAARHLGHDFDIHGGGTDLVFPHHENEIAQHEAAHGAPFARYWVHNGMVQMADAKMSKSVGNVIGLEDALARWGRGAMRVWYATAAYSKPLAFSEDLLDEAAAEFDTFVTFVRNARAASGGVQPDPEVTRRHVAAFEEALDDDLNLPGALAALHETVNEGNALLLRADADDTQAQAAVSALATTVVDLADQVLGLGIEATLRPAEELAERFAPLVDELLRRRDEAREARDFATADAIRDLLGRAGVTVEDRPAGVRWHLEPRFSLTPRPAPQPGQEEEAGGLATARI
ncbi:MAG TPA: cysteine--tRNA ligase [Nitriliruptorales bacterium]|nr:cysteine--tRNA ligase [Nitriliruptorales bacterium]